MFPGPLGHSLAGKALEAGLWSFRALQIRDFATDKHQKVDDSPYGGGDGMVMKPDVIDAAIRTARAQALDAPLIYLTPRGVPLTQSLIKELSASSFQLPASKADSRKLIADSSLILLCGRYEGIDERVIEAHKPLEISVGDYILSGGEMAAMVLMDSLIRLIPGVMGAEGSGREESFGCHEDAACLLEYPHYTRPPVWDGRFVPEPLLSGDHAKIKAWRRQQAEAVTKARRPDLWKKYTR
jgi:tRNA (guanine37-N1)-methyltransferase